MVNTVAEQEITASLGYVHTKGTKAKMADCGSDFYEESTIK